MSFRAMMRLMLTILAIQSASALGVAVAFGEPVPMFQAGILFSVGVILAGWALHWMMQRPKAAVDETTNDA